MDGLPECQEDKEEERIIRKLNRSNRPKLPTDEIKRLETCDAPLTRDELVEMSVGKQWGALEVMVLLKEEQSGEGNNVTINMANDSSASPKPPPTEAPWYMRAVSENPSSSSRNNLGDKNSKGKDPKGKSPKGEEGEGKDSE